MSLSCFDFLLFARRSANAVGDREFLGVTRNRRCRFLHDTKACGYGVLAACPVPKGQHPGYLQVLLELQACRHRGKEGGNVILIFPRRGASLQFPPIEKRGRGARGEHRITQSHLPISEVGLAEAFQIP